jgi:hypothetical protein
VPASELVYRWLHSCTYKDRGTPTSLDALVGCAGGPRSASRLPDSTGANRYSPERLSCASRRPLAGGRAGSTLTSGASLTGDYVSGYSAACGRRQCAVVVGWSDVNHASSLHHTRATVSQSTFGAARRSPGATSLDGWLRRPEGRRERRGHPRIPPAGRRRERAYAGAVPSTFSGEVAVEPWRSAGVEPEVPASPRR